MIRPATPQDLPAIAAIYEAILAQEDARPVSFTNWQRGKYPTQDTARAALEAGTLFTAEENGRVYGCVNLNGEQLPEYADIPWLYAAQDNEVGVIHTLVIHPAWSGKGKARELVAFCEEHCRQQGKRVIRLDTYVNNQPANSMYPRLGYRFAGTSHFLFQGFLPEDLNCYEKLL